MSFKENHQDFSNKKSLHPENVLTYIDNSLQESVANTSNIVPQGGLAELRSPSACMVTFLNHVGPSPAFVSFG